MEPLSATRADAARSVFQPTGARSMGFRAGADGCGAAGRTARPFPAFSAASFRRNVPASMVW